MGRCIDYQLKQTFPQGEAMAHANSFPGGIVYEVFKFD